MFSLPYDSTHWVKRCMFIWACAMLGVTAYFIWLTPFYADDWWHRASLRDRSWWEWLTIPVFGDRHHLPFYHFWMGWVSLQPIESWSVTWISWLGLGITTGLFHVYLKQAGVRSWLRWLGVGSWLAMPTIGQSLFWTASFHLWHSLLWLLLGLVLLPRQPVPFSWKRWLGLSLAWLAALLTSEFAYAPVLVLLLIFFGKYRNFFPIPFILLATLLAMAGIVAWRNQLVTGHWWQLARSESLQSHYSLREAYTQLQEILTTTHPWLMPWKLIPSGYLQQTEFSHVVLLVSMLAHALFWSILWQKHGRNGWDLTILAWGAPGMVLLAGGKLEERYLIFPIAAHALASALWLERIWEETWKRRYLITGIVIALLFFNTKTTLQRHIEHWGFDSWRYRQLVSRLQSHPPTAQSPVGIVDGLGTPFQAFNPKEQRAALTTTLADLRFLEQAAGRPACLYDLKLKTPFSPDQQQLNTLLELRRDCPWPPKMLDCFIYRSSMWGLGTWEAYHGIAHLGYFEQDHLHRPREITLQCH